MEKESSGNKNDLRIILSNNYNITETENINRVNTGYGSECYYISTKDKSYILKLTEGNSLNNIDQLQTVHEALAQEGINVVQFFMNMDGQLITQHKEKSCLLQSYIIGSVIPHNTAPHWFMMESPRMLGRIHKALETIPLLNEGMGEDFLKFSKSERIEQYYHDSLNIAQANGQSKIASDIEYRISILESVQNINLDIKKFTLKNTHGDYKIDQLICGKDKINGVIDIDGCVHPICWEIIRSYTYADPECISGNINIENMKRYVESYLKISDLNYYDLKMMPYFYFFQLAVCNYFGQYYSITHPNRHLLLENAHWSTSLCRWFEYNVQTLSDELVRAF